MHLQNELTHLHTCSRPGYRLRLYERSAAGRPSAVTVMLNNEMVNILLLKTISNLRKLLMHGMQAFAEQIHAFAYLLRQRRGAVARILNNISQ